MIDLADIDKRIISALRGLDVFDAIFYGTGDPKSCTVTRDALELSNEYGVTVVESGARIGYRRADVGDPRIGNRFEFDGSRYIIEDKEPSQDSSWRYAHCREEVIDD